MLNDSLLNKSVNQLKSNASVRKIVDRMPRKLKVSLRQAIDKATTRKPQAQIVGELNAQNTLLSQLLYEMALRTERNQEQKRLINYGFKVYSQHDEDGIIEEIFRRIGSTDRFFVEFGVGDGLENCTLYCLLKGWSGVWIDGSAICVTAIEQKFRYLMKAERLKVRYAFITADEIEEHFQELGVPEEFDLLSVDIDNNDYWVWKSITHYRPRVVAIEYNASFRCTNSVVPHNPTAIWDYTNYFGAGLKALEVLGKEKGYCLVGCNYTGVTAFFVREDLVASLFAEPFSAENHYEPPRYFVRMPNGHPPGFGPVVEATTQDGARQSPWSHQ